MNRLFTISTFFILIGCQHDIKVTKAYELYFDQDTYVLFKKGVDIVKKKNYPDTVVEIMTKVINASKSKINNRMPVELNPYYYRASAYFDLNKHKECISDCEKVLTDTTRDSELYLWQAESYRNLNEPEKGLQFCRKALILGLDSATTLYETGLCFITLKNYETACENFVLSKSLGFNPEAFKDYYSYCESLR